MLITLGGSGISICQSPISLNYEGYKDLHEFE